ncbi:MAG: TraR/DksA family transcriptional regulator [Saprospiraceae bacterium]
MNSQDVIVRYSDKDLAEFKVSIEEKLTKVKSEFKTITQELSNIESNDSNRFNNINESSLSYERDYLSKMAERQNRFIRDLENALLRIQNKTYGICIVTGELIDKRRLKAVPHTTKSIKAKMKQ